MTTVEHYEVLIVGAGTAGKTLAAAIASSGRRVAVVERAPELIGGTCINLACIPSKTVIRSAEIAELARRSGAFGVDATLGGVEPAAILARKRAVVEAMRAGSLRLIEDNGADVIYGDAHFIAPRQVEVGSRVLEGEHVVLNLGARPALPDIAGLAHARPLTSESVLEFDRIPERLVVLGGGYVGVELGQAMHRLGSQVTIVERGPQLLAGEDADIAAEVAELLRQDGLEIHLDTPIEGVTRSRAGVVRVDVGERQALVADDVLVALGRTPNSEGVGLDAAGVEVDERGFVRVDERLRTSAERTYAVGDINGGPQFTHVAMDDHRIVQSNLEGGDRTTLGRLIPYCVFIEPELGRIGLTEREARSAGHDIRVARIPAGAVPRAMTLGATRGTFKAIVERGSDRILGAAILGAHGGEVIAAIQMAMLGGLTAAALRDAIFTHPTMAEGLNDLFS